MTNTNPYAGTPSNARVNADESFDRLYKAVVFGPDADPPTSYALLPQDRWLPIWKSYLTDLQKVYDTYGVMRRTLGWEFDAAIDALYADPMAMDYQWRTGAVDRLVSQYHADRAELIVIRDERVRDLRELLTVTIEMALA